MEVLGILSLIFWSLIVVVTVKYVFVIMRADNAGEGGVLALAALLGLHKKSGRKGHGFLVLIAAAGGALLFGDAVITPAISILSAVEGTRDISPVLAPLSLPLACFILVLLFFAQRYGVMRLSAFFTPVMLAWFLALAASGLASIVRYPGVFSALMPGYALALLIEKPSLFLGIMGGVFLTVTGGEALYADLGQFGRRAIARAWLFVVLPSLMLNYFGQGALLLSQPHIDIENIFYGLFPSFLLIPAICLATFATIIASQAVITGLSSLANQAVSLGFMPSMKIVHMAADNEHNVYLPFVNALLAFLSISAVLFFRSSDEMADAYGVMVAGSMVTTTVLFGFFIMRKPGGWKSVVISISIIPLVAIDLVFFATSASKIFTGALFPVALASAVFLVSLAWQAGYARLLVLHRASSNRPFEDVSCISSSAERIGVFLVHPEQRHSVAFEELSRLTGSRFRAVLLLSVHTDPVPSVPLRTRFRVTDITPGISRLDVHVGYMQKINLPELIEPVLRVRHIDHDKVTYVTGLERPLAPKAIKSAADMLLFIFPVLARLATRRADRFGLPALQTIEAGKPRQL